MGSPEERGEDGGAGAAMSRLRHGLLPGLGQTAIGAAAMGTASILNMFLVDLVGYRSVALIYLLAINLLSLVLSTTAIIVAALFSAVLWIYLFIPPRFAIRGASVEDLLMLAMYFITAFVSGVATSRLRESRGRMEFLHDFARSLSELGDAPQIATMSVQRIASYLGRRAVIFLRGEDGRIDGAHPIPETGLAEADVLAVEACFAGRQPAGRQAGDPSPALFAFFPLRTPDAVVGVFGLALPGRRLWRPARENDLVLLLRTLSISLEREALHKAQEKIVIEKESERLGSILLNTVSHEIRTPLTAIQGAASSLLEEGGDANPALRSALLTEVLDASDKLNGTVENLLSMSRLESGRLKLHRTIVDVEELMGIALDSVRPETGNHPLKEDLAAGEATVSVDFVLMAQAVANLLQNAFRHTPDGTPVEVTVRPDGGEIELTVQDRGPGVGEGDLPHLFDKFYRGEKAFGGGTGLGLAISAGIVQAHGGRIAARLREGGGLAFTIRLPLATDGGGPP